MQAQITVNGIEKPKEIKAMIICFDNGGKTLDRYTVVIDGEVYGMSEDPNSPQGFNQYNGTVEELGAVREAIESGEEKNVGKSIEVFDLPVEVRLAISRRLSQ